MTDVVVLKNWKLNFRKKDLKQRSLRDTNIYLKLLPNQYMPSQLEDSQNMRR